MADGVTACPISVGMDLVDVAEVEESLARFGDPYLQRVFTPREVAACGGDARRLAACFAAKEAVAKTFDAGDEALDWRSIEVLGGTGRDGHGRRSPGTARRSPARAGIGRFERQRHRRRTSTLWLSSSQSADGATDVGA